MAYATAADLFWRCDVRTINDLANDGGVRQSVEDLATNPVITAMLDDASGAIDAAIRKGDRYAAEDLAALTGNPLAHLKRITCIVAMSYLFERRPGLYPELAERYDERSRKYISRLARGEDVFDIDANQAKSHPTVLGPSLAHMSKMNDLIPDQALHYYPTERPYRWPISRQ